MLYIIKDNYLFILFTVILIIIDQFTKSLAILNLENLLVGIQVLPFMDLVFVTNKGISFGMLAELNISFYLGILSIFISILLLYWLIKSQKNFEKFSISLILGGALGNGYDRIKQSYVIDFIDIYYETFHWPAFNLADSFITIGVLIYLFLNRHDILPPKK